MKTCKRGLHQYEGKRCPECHAERKRAWNVANPGRNAELSRAWHAARPGYRAKIQRAWRAANPERNAELNRAGLRAWYAKNKDRHKKTMQAWYAANPGRHAKMMQAWHKEHPEADRDKRHRRRAQVRGNGAEKITKADLDALLRFQESRCAYCAKPLDKTKHLDHVVPIARGGGHFLSNLAWACPGCNLSKHDKTAAEFRKGDNRIGFGL